MKITSEVFQVGGGRLTSPEDAAIYLIRFGDRAALVDAGCGGSREKLLSNIRGHQVKLEQIEYLLLTHCHFDHTGGAGALKAKIPFKIVAHELDAPFLEEGDDEVTAATWYGASIDPFPVDIKLSGARQDLLLEDRLIHAIHTPGHSPGSVVYLIESEGMKVLFGQDVHGPIDPKLLSDRGAYRKSLELLLSLGADILCEGHYGIFKGKDEVAELIEHFLKRS